MNFRDSNSNWDSLSRRERAVKVMRAAYYDPSNIPITTMADVEDAFGDAWELLQRACLHCGDVLPEGWDLEDHFNCNFAEDFVTQEHA